MPKLIRALQLANVICLIGVTLLWSLLVLQTIHPHHGHLIRSTNMASIYYTSFDPFLLMALPLFLWRCKEEYLDHRFRRHPRSLRRDRVRMRMTLGAVRHLGFLVLLNKYYKGRTMNPREINVGTGNYETG